MHIHYTSQSDHIYFFSPAADTLDYFGSYTMEELADFRPPVQFFNPIRLKVITETNRVICYNQIIYGDVRLEEDEYFSLILLAQDRTSIISLLDPQHDSSVIRIIDDDGRSHYSYLLSILTF